LKTVFMLLAQYETPAVKLELICEDYFNMGYRTASQKAKAGSLPVPAFQCGNSQKSTWFVHVNDLAKLIDDRRKQARFDWHGGE